MSHYPRACILSRIFMIYNGQKLKQKLQKFDILHGHTSTYPYQTKMIMLSTYRCKLYVVYADSYNTTKYIHHDATWKHMNLQMNLPKSKTTGHRSKKKKRFVFKWA